MYLFLTPDVNTIRSYWCQKHGDVVPRGDENDERMQSVLSDVQDGIYNASTVVERDSKDILSEHGVPSEA